jgi:hypothetical protein
LEWTRNQRTFHQSRSLRAVQFRRYVFLLKESVTIQEALVMKPLSLCTVLLLSISACSSDSRPSRPSAAPSAQRADVSPLVPADLVYAKGFVQHLSDSGWAIQLVLPSKFNGFFHETKKAVFIETDKGILEVVFFDEEADVARIQTNEEKSGIPDFHKYRVTSARTTQRIEGGATYFTKYRNMLIMTGDHDLTNKLSRILT